MLDFVPSPCTDGHSEEALAKLVSRDSMIGVCNPHVPDPVAAD